MLGTLNYPITIAEMLNYTKDADEYFKEEEHEQLKTFLALHPESGDVLAGTDGVRLLRWPIKARAKSPSARVIYYFRDLNMPLYMLALYRRGDQIPLDSASKGEIKRCVGELVAEHGSRLASIVVRQLRGGKEPA